MKDLVSIIMPMYNSAAFVVEAIQSVLAQTYTNWELIIVDDCSSDDSVSHVREFCHADSRIHLLQTNKASGSPTTPRNEGVKHANGRFIAFLESDDMWLPMKLEEQLKVFNDSDDSVAIVFSDYEKIKECGTRSGRIVKAPASANYASMLKGNVIGNLTGMYDTAKVGKVFFKQIHHEDYVMWLSILKQGYMARNTGTVAALYRVRSESLTSKKIALLTWQWNIYVNVEKTGYLRAIYYYAIYACKGLWKSLI